MSSDKEIVTAAPLEEATSHKDTASFEGATSHKDTDSFEENVPCIGTDFLCEEEQFMLEAYNEAKKAMAIGEVPVGAAIVKDGRIIALAHNLRESQSDATAHAEVLCIREASRALGGWNLHDCDLYVTLEPCPMCMGAAINARLSRVVFGAYDKKAGSAGSLINLSELPYNHRPIIKGGVLENETAELLREFFAKLRIRKARWKK